MIDLTKFLKFLIFLYLFFFVMLIPLPFISFVDDTYVEEVVVPYLPTTVYIEAVVREESYDKNFSLDRVEKVKEVLNNYSLVPSIYSYKDKEGKPYYVYEWRFRAYESLDIDWTSLLKEVDYLNVRFFKDKKELDDMALNSTSFMPKGFVIEHSKKANCYSSNVVFKSSSVVPNEEEVRCYVEHNYKTLSFEFNSLYNLIKGLLRGG